MQDERFPDLVWDYHTMATVPAEDWDKVKRPTVKKLRIPIPSRLRYQMLAGHPYCALCGATVGDGIHLEVDHINGDPSNNQMENLQVLCQPCNNGKAG